MEPIMEHPDYGEWHDIDLAPRDGTRILVMIRESEQGPAEVDVARWGRSRAGESWIASDSDHDCAIVYTDADLAYWMPLPSPLPRLRAGSAARSAAPKAAKDETYGSGI
jgi:hypothetical protein